MATPWGLTARPLAPNQAHLQSQALALTQRWGELATRIHTTMRPYAELMRLEKPIGTWLLYWPGAWSIAMACRAQPGEELVDWRLLGLFGVGALVMRGAGCTINDMWDRRLDRLVERTKGRPLASDRLTLRQALIFLGAQLGVGLVILTRLNGPSIAVGAASLALVVSYPLMKRITYWPQLVLGLAFNWGALLGWIARTGSFRTAVCGPLYGGGIAWTLLYDTIYALQDIKDDRQAGVRSTALLFGPQVKRWLSGFAVAALAGWTWAGISLDAGWPYFAAVGATGAHFAWQICQLRPADCADCLAKFKSNRWVGAILFAGVVADIAVSRAGGLWAAIGGGRA